MHHPGRRPPVEVETEYYGQQSSTRSWFTRNRVCMEVGTLQSRTERTRQSDPLPSLSSTVDAITSR